MPVLKHISTLKSIKIKIHCLVIVLLFSPRHFLAWPALAGSCAPMKVRTHCWGGHLWWITVISVGPLYQRCEEAGSPHHFTHSLALQDKTVPGQMVGGGGAWEMPLLAACSHPMQSSSSLDANQPVAAVHPMFFTPCMSQVLHKGTVTCACFSLAAVSQSLMMLLDFWVSCVML